MSLTPTFILHSAGPPLHVGHFEHYFVILTSLGLITRSFSSSVSSRLKTPAQQVFDVSRNTRRPLQSDAVNCEKTLHHSNTTL